MSQKYFALIIATGLLLAPHAYAAEGGGSQFGAVYGLSVPDADNTTSRKLFGAKGSAYLAPTFSMGGYYFQSQDESPGGSEFKYSLHGLEGSFHFGGGSGDTFLSLRVGLSKVRTDVVGSTDVIYSPYHYGIASGYDYAVLSWLTFGFEGSFMHVQDSSTTKAGTHYALDGFSIINFLLCAQLRL